MRGKQKRVGEPVPMAPKRKRQARRRDRHSDKQELGQFIGCSVTKMGQIVLLYRKEDNNA